MVPQARRVGAHLKLCLETPGSNRGRGSPALPSLGASCAPPGVIGAEAEGRCSPGVGPIPARPLARRHRARSSLPPLTPSGSSSCKVGAFGSDLPPRPAALVKGSSTAQGRLQRRSAAKRGAHSPTVHLALEVPLVPPSYLPPSVPDAILRDVKCTVESLTQAKPEAFVTLLSVCCLFAPCQGTWAHLGCCSDPSISPSPLLTL